jgi:hypothetical protein
MENESQWIQVDPCNIHYTKRNVTPGPYKQCATPQEEDVKYLGATPWQETYLAQTETARNRPHQNVLVTGTQVKTLYKQQTSHIYKTIWTYKIQLWGMASTSNIEILERF